MKTQILGFFTPWIAYAVITLLHFALPGRWIKGYVKHSQTGETLNYRLNGLLVLASSIVIWLVLGLLHWVPLDWLYQSRWTSLIGAVTLGLLFSLIMVLPFPAVKKSLFADLWFGRLENPQYRNGRIDAKMWLYLIGAVMLQLNVLSFAVHHFTSYEDFNPGVILGAAMLSWFIWEYLNFEKVHLYTYDFIAERVGLKLGFGCLTFYPYFYAVALWATVDLPNPHLPLWADVCFAVIFFAGWSLARGANMQKYYFKTQPEKAFLGIKPETFTDGKRTLLINGFWGLSRHINYLGEILMGCGIALSAGYPAVWWVWLYPVYYVGLLFTRQMDDDKICKAKYGKLWNAYTKKVKYRIIPFIY
ncbi:7-dehydrocholesterol reductase [Spirochaetia bacterium]|nr:7-dehydrocholesterol reductase [Spirochaetia bacterium]